MSPSALLRINFVEEDQNDRVVGDEPSHQLFAGSLNVVPTLFTRFPILLLRGFLFVGILPDEFSG